MPNTQIKIHANASAKVLKMNIVELLPKGKRVSFHIMPNKCQVSGHTGHKRKGCLISSLLSSQFRPQ